MNKLRFFLFMLLPLVAAQAKADAVSVADVEATAGQKAEIVVSLTTAATDLTGYQMSLYLPEGVTLQTEEGDYLFELSERHNRNHVFSVNDQADGGLLLVCYSPTKKTISAGDGELVRLPVDVALTAKGALTAQLRTVKVSDTSSKVTQLADVTFTISCAEPESSGTPAVDVTDVSSMADAIYIAPFEARIGDVLDIEVSLKSVGETTSYGFELVLPAGMTIATDGDGAFDDAVTLSARNSKHTVTTNRLPDGSYKLGVASLSSKALTGSDGVAVTIRAQVADDMAVGTYPVVVRSPLIVYTNGSKPQVSDTQTAVTVEDYKTGDVDGDDVVDLADAVLVINHYVGKPAEPFVAKAADVDGDGVVDLADAVFIINYYVGKIPALSREQADNGHDPE